MVALIAIIEGIVGGRAGLVDPVALEWRYAAKGLQGRGKTAEVLCLGDSLIKFAVAAPVLAERNGCRASNHAVPAAPALASHLALRAALDAGARPRVVVVSYAPFLLMPGFQLNRSFLPEVVGPGTCLDLAWTGANPELAGALLLARLVPSIRHRDRLRRGAGRLVGEHAPRPRTRRPDLWLPGGDESVFDQFYPTDWRAAPEHERQIDRLATLAAAHGAAVLWVMPPIGPPTRQEWDALGLSARYAAFAASVQARHANLTIIDARALPTAPEDRLDPLHLNRRGAAAFTARLAPWLEPAHLAQAPRWVDLADPPDRDPLLIRAEGSVQ